jgi:hypothetical protein
MAYGLEGVLWNGYGTVAPRIGVVSMVEGIGRASPRTPGPDTSLEGIDRFGPTASFVRPWCFAPKVVKPTA